VNQLGQINALQKTVGEPLQLHVTGVGPKTKKLLDQRYADKWIKKSEDKKIASVKLPIAEHLKLKTSSILTVNQCIVKRLRDPLTAL